MRSLPSHRVYLQRRSCDQSAYLSIPQPIVWPTRWCRNPWHFNAIIFRREKKGGTEREKKRYNPFQNITSLIREAVDSPDLESSRSAEPLVWVDLGLTEGPLTGYLCSAPTDTVYIYIYIYIYKYNHTQNICLYIKGGK